MKNKNIVLEKMDNDEYEIFKRECVNINELPENEELDFWPVKKGHKCKVLKDNTGTWRIIDLGIADLIQALWDEGYETLFCCEGHAGNKNHCKYGGYISFEQNPKNLELIEKIKGNDVVRIKKESVNYKTGRYVIRFYPVIPEDTTEFKEEFKKLIYNAIRYKNTRSE